MHFVLILMFALWRNYLFPDSDLDNGIYPYCGKVSIQTLEITEIFLGTFIGAQEWNGPLHVSSR